MKIMPKTRVPNAARQLVRARFGKTLGEPLEYEDELRKKHV